MRRHRVGKLAGVLDLVDRDQHLRRNLLVQLDVLLELGNHRAGQRFEFLGLAGNLGQHFGEHLEERLVLGERGDAGAATAFDQHLHGTVGQLEKLQHGAHRPDLVDVVGSGIVLRRVFLRDEQNLLVLTHHVLEGAHRLLAADEQRHDHVREHDDVTERQNRINFAAG